MVILTRSHFASYIAMLVPSSFMQRWIESQILMTVHLYSWADITSFLCLLFAMSLNGHSVVYYIDQYAQILY